MDTQRKEEDDDRIHQLFDEFDEDKNGKIQVHEIRDHLKAMKLPYTDHYVSELMNTIDIDHDGNICYKEFKEYILRKKRELRDVFDEFDLNHDGVIDRNEVKAMLLKMNMPHTSNDVDRLMEKMDLDHNGRIDFDEWTRLLMMLPKANIHRICEYWREAAVLDVEHGMMGHPKATNTKSIIVHLLSGAMSGAISKTGTAPFERLKLLYQVHHGENPSVWRGIQSMYATQGFRSLWRGNGVHILKVSSESGLRFFTYSLTKKLFGVSDENLTVVELFVAASTATALSHTIFYPLEVLKTRISLSDTQVSMLQMTKRIAQNEGKVLPFFRGLGISLSSVVLVSGMNLTIYEKVKRWIIKDWNEKDPTIPQLLTAGSLSATTSQVIFYPMHTVRARMISQVSDEQKTTSNVILNTIKHEGVGGLFKGITPSLIKAIPSQCICFVAYEKLAQFFDSKLGVNLI